MRVRSLCVTTGSYCLSCWHLSVNSILAEFYYLCLPILPAFYPPGDRQVRRRPCRLAGPLQWGVHLSLPSPYWEPLRYGSSRGGFSYSPHLLCICTTLLDVIVPSIDVLDGTSVYSFFYVLQYCFWSWKRGRFSLKCSCPNGVVWFNRGVCAEYSGDLAE